MSLSNDLIEAKNLYLGSIRLVLRCLQKNVNRVSPAIEELIKTNSSKFKDEEIDECLRNIVTLSDLLKELGR